MGVLACSNVYCENIMCDRYSSEYGYICEDCFDRLVELGRSTNIAEFMDSKKNHYSEYDVNFCYFDRIFPKKD